MSSLLLSSQSTLIACRQSSPQLHHTKSPHLPHTQTTSVPHQTTTPAPRQTPSLHHTRPRLCTTPDRTSAPHQTPALHHSRATFYFYFWGYRTAASADCQTRASSAQCQGCLSSVSPSPPSLQAESILTPNPISHSNSVPHWLWLLPKPLSLLNFCWKLPSEFPPKLTGSPPPSLHSLLFF